MHTWSTKRSLFAKYFLWMDVIFRDESNEPSSTMICYSDTTVITPNHTVNDLISLQYHSYGVNFVIRLH